MPGAGMPGAGYGEQPLYPEPSPPSLADAVRAFTTGSLSAEDFQQVFATSKVYCPRGDNPGFLALHNTQQPVIPMFTSLKELRRYAGKESKYFVITGAEVIDLLPTGYGFVLDMGGRLDVSLVGFRPRRDSLIRPGRFSLHDRGSHHEGGRLRHVDRRRGRSRAR